ncbi:DUF4118 domain-containing protein [Streptomyces sp. NK15101]|uniref:DUF4118 domain-containing protein n=1 Tax=Streptomyces sp. NK15101 TaxID=2873261 RepID=UPI001CEDE275|nr:DUF4118 domain-containing protein [Streptomyces sp. NK15101]
MMRMPIRDVVAVTAAVLAPFLVALTLLPLRRSVTSTNLALVLVVVVVAVSALGNRWAGALAAVSAVAWFDFFHTEPYQSFDIRDRADVETALLLLVVGLLVSQLAARARVMRSAAGADAEYLERLHGTIRLMRSGGGAAPELIDRFRRDLVDVLELRECRFTFAVEPAGSPPPRLQTDGSVRVEGWIWDLERQGWPDGEIELPALAAGKVRGRFLLTPVPGAVPVPVEARLVAVDLAGLAAVVLEGSGRLVQAGDPEDGAGRLGVDV